MFSVFSSLIFNSICVTAVHVMHWGSNPWVDSWLFKKNCHTIFSVLQFCLHFSSAVLLICARQHWEVKWDKVWIKLNKLRQFRLTAVFWLSMHEWFLDINEVNKFDFKIWAHIIDIYSFLYMIYMYIFSHVYIFCVVSQTSEIYKNTFQYNVIFHT